MKHQNFITSYLQVFLATLYLFITYSLKLTAITLGDKMNVLVIGSGGREHAMVWKISKSNKINKIYCVPGNGGISEIAECVNINPEETDELIRFVKKNSIDITVVGPEIPLAKGIVGEFEKNNLRIFGPSKEAARLEGSKSFAKEFMKQNNIPTAKFKTFDSIEKVKNFIEECRFPLVIKADGLAAGKGVIIVDSMEDALKTLYNIMEIKIFGQAGDKVIVEEMLHGEEASFLVFTDGNSVIPMPSSQDHKRIFDNDQGPNTGGMGAYSPAPVINKSLEKKIMERVIYPTINGMKKEGKIYKGILYAGIMVCNGEPFVLEFNARFGDPETQPILMRMKSDIIPVIEAVINGNLGEIKINWDERAAVCIVMASKGYPGDYEKGKEIAGLSEAGELDDVVIFHAGTKKEENKFYTTGGRVLGVTALGNGIKEAISRAYEATEKISFDGAHFRKDIGKRALGRI